MTTSADGTLVFIPVLGLPEVVPGTSLPGMLAEHLYQWGPRPEPGDSLVVTQKIVSKAESRFVRLSSITPSPQAHQLAQETRKDPRLVELVLRESSEVVRKAPNVLITRHLSGHVMANAGIDASNAGPVGADEVVLLLPENPDASAQAIAIAIASRFGHSPAVLISDSFGRPWRVGTVNVAIGLSGMPAVRDQRGERDRDGRILQMTQPAIADAVAAAAGLVMGETRESRPAVLVRGLDLSGTIQSSAALLRPVQEDLFR